MTYISYLSIISYKTLQRIIPYHPYHEPYPDFRTIWQGRNPSDKATCLFLEYMRSASLIAPTLFTVMHPLNVNRPSSWWTTTHFIPTASSSPFSFTITVTWYSFPVSMVVFCPLSVSTDFISIPSHRFDTLFFHAASFPANAYRLYARRWWRDARSDRKSVV